MVALSLTQLSIKPKRSWFNHLEKPLAALLISLGLTVASVSQAPAYSAEPFTEPTQTATADTWTLAQQVLDGVYLYGQSQEAMQIGSEYLVFEVNQDHVVGAFYMPHSSFDCFVGEVEERRLSLTIFNAYDQSTHSHSIALNGASSVVTSTTGATREIVGLEGFYPIQEVSDLDQELLNTCRATHL